MTKEQHYMTERERYQLEAYRRAGKGVSWIAREMGFCRQTIYNELRRGNYIHLYDWREEERYSADKGQQIFSRRQRNKGRPAKLSTDPEYRQFLEDRLTGVQPDGKRDKWKRCSPAVALEFARREGFSTSVCVGTLYRYIYQGRMGRARACDLWEAPYRRKPKEDENKGRVAHPHLPSIEIRPAEINQREELGHKEMDLVVSGKKGRAALLTLTDRKSRCEIIRKIPSKEAASVVKALRSLKRHHSIKSLSTDNGSEFLAYEALKKIVPEIYYCHSYSAWEKGTNENHNRMIRRWYPKGTNFDKVSVKRLAELEAWMNDYPRKSLGWLTPREVEEGTRCG